MKYTKKDLASYNLHLINTDKFKTIRVRVVFSNVIKKEEITIRNVLSDILLQSSNEYKSRRDLTIKAEELYSAEIYNNTKRIGNYITTSISLETLNDKYTEEGNFEESLKFLSEIIFNPDVKDKKFNRDKLDIVLNNANVALDSIKEDTSSYSLIRLMEAYDKKSPTSYRMIGYKEDLEKINTENLYTYYENMINSDYVDIFVAGEINNKEVINLIKKYFKFRKIKKRKKPIEIKAKRCRKRRLIAKESLTNNQSKLSIACPISKMTSYEKQYPLTLASIIFGVGPDSKLFKEVRENNSLCYTIFAYPQKEDNVMIIQAGIDKYNYDKSLRLITELLKSMKKGKFTTKDIDIAKEYYNTSIEEVEESLGRIIGEYLSVELLGIDSYKEREKIIKKVTKREIVKVCKKINMDTVFLLEGVNDEEN